LKKDRTGDLAGSVAHFVCNAPALPPVTQERACKVVTDTFAAMVAGVTSEVLAPLSRYVAAQGGISQPSHAVLGTALRCSTEDAALINATLAAALEFDDVLSLMPAHPSAVVIAALAANCKALASSGAQILHSYAVGIEVGVRIAQAITLDHYKRGFHATGTLALFSAVAALCHVEKMDASQVKRCLGVAASMASGVQANFGSMTKPLHSGLAAKNALATVSLVQSGLTANESVFETEGGFFSAYGSDASHEDRMPAKFAAPWVLDEPGITLKLFPCCYASHRGMDALMVLMRELNVDASAIYRIEAKAPPGGLVPLKFDRPCTAFESLFSLPYALAVTALDGLPGLASFTLARVNAADVRAMLERIEVTESMDCVAHEPDWANRSYGSRGQVQVTLHTRDGRSAQTEVRISPGHPERALSWAQMEGKWTGCLCAAGFSLSRSEELFKQVRSFETLSQFSDFVEQLALP
jgi:2-methylcitrate dehydratase PrpD